MSKHTPGPWIVGSTGENIWGNDNRSKIATIPRDSPYIVILEEREANAYLISAAPELLEACKEAETYLNALPLGKLTPQMNYILGHLQQVILKAEGVK